MSFKDSGDYEVLTFELLSYENTLECEELLKLKTLKALEHFFIELKTFFVET
jgi:hypothetical protein